MIRRVTPGREGACLNMERWGKMGELIKIQDPLIEDNSLRNTRNFYIFIILVNYNFHLINTIKTRFVPTTLIKINQCYEVRN